MNCRKGKINAANPKIYSPVLVASKRENGGTPPLAARVLVDTGAEVSCITPELAAELNPPWAGYIHLEAANGAVSRQDLYDIKICVPPPESEAADVAPDTFHSLKVAEYYCGGDIDMLLGLDAIINGSLEVKGVSFTLCL